LEFLIIAAFALGIGATLKEKQCVSLYRSKVQEAEAKLHTEQFKSLLAEWTITDLQALLLEQGLAEKTEAGGFRLLSRDKIANEEIVLGGGSLEAAAAYRLTLSDPPVLKKHKK